METITSAQNPKVKKLLALQEKSRLRREEGLFVVEGRRELEHCIEAGYEIDSIFICEEIASDPEDLMRRFETSGGIKVFSVSKEVYEKISYRGSTEGVVAEVRSSSRTLSPTSTIQTLSAPASAPFSPSLQSPRLLKRR